MSGERSSPFESETLDPSNWNEALDVGHLLLEDMVEYLRTVRGRPAWTPLTQEALTSLREPAPCQGTSIAEVFEDFRTNVLPYGLGNIHPRFWGWVIGTGSVAGVFADIAISAMNTNVAGFQSSATHVEDAVVGWIKQLFGFPDSASGAIVDGGSVANLVGIAAGLYAGDRVRIRDLGITASGLRPVFYTSTQTHFSVVRAARLLGVGEAQVRKIGVNKKYQIDTALLIDAVETDLRAGLHPTMIIGHCGTVGVGAFDPLDDLADIAAKFGMWLHVDAAFGGCVVLHEELKERGAGLDRADSLSFDLHKWLHVPIDAACILVRDRQAHTNAFGIDAPYLADLGGGPASDSNHFTNLGLQQSRSARGVKTWLLLKHFGLQRLGEMVYKNVRQAEMLGRMIDEAADFELLAEVQLNIVCFRYLDASLSIDELNELNRRIMRHLHEEGHAIPSPFKIGDEFAIRCAITNHRTTDADLDYLLAAIRNFVKARTT
jgi:aromatic-L-amino-acid decarboxylase